MKKFTKIALAAAGIFAAIGVTCVIILLCMGMTMGKFMDMVENGNFSFHIKHHGIVWGNGAENVGKEDILTLDSRFENMDIEFGSGNHERGAGVLQIAYGDVSVVQIEKKGLSGFEAYIEDRTLYIEATSRKYGNSDSYLKITLPNNMRLREVDLEIGTTAAQIYDLKADSVSIELGVGAAEVAKLDAKSVEIEVGVGELTLSLMGVKEDYNYTVECGIGSVYFGDTALSGFGNASGNANMGAERWLDIECGIGEVTVDFVDAV